VSHCGASAGRAGGCDVAPDGPEPSAAPEPPPAAPPAIPRLQSEELASLASVHNVWRARRHKTNAFQWPTWMTNRNPRPVDSAEEALRKLRVQAARWLH
jgi:hypothetical protein